MMIFKCKNEFCIETVDYEGFLTGKTSIISQDSLWRLNNKNNKFDGEIHLDNVDASDPDLMWIEISKYDLKKYFVIESEPSDKANPS